MLYPVKVKKVGASYIASFEHANGRFQGACEAATKKEVLQEAIGLLQAMITSAVQEGELVPMPDSCQSGNHKVSISAKLGMKVLLNNTLITSGKSKSQIGRNMNKTPTQIGRIFNPEHNSTMDEMEAALSAMGYHLDLRLSDLRLAA